MAHHRAQIVRAALVVGLLAQMLYLQGSRTILAAGAASAALRGPISSLSSPLSAPLSPLSSPLSPAGNTVIGSDKLTPTQALSPSGVAPLSPAGTINIEVREPRVWKLDSNLGEVSLFRGNVQYAYPIEVPAMQDDLQPQLAVAYSSAAADQGAAAVNSLGTGWTLDIPRITQGVHLYSDSGCWQWDSGHMNCLLATNYYRMDVEGNDPHYPNDPYSYKLNWNGRQYDLLAKGHPGTTIGEYTTETYQPFRVWQCSTASVCNGIPAPGVNTNKSGLYWQLWTPNGTLYVFGVDSDHTLTGNDPGTSHSERFFHVSECTDYYGNGWQWDSKQAQAWYIRHVYAPVRDNSTISSTWSVEYNYEKEAVVSQGGNWPQWCNIYWYDPEVRLSSIRYGNSLYRAATSQNQYVVGVSYQATTINGATVRQPQAITVTAFDTGLYTYTLSYNANHALSAIRRDDRDGVRNQLVSLPGTTFEYSSTLASTLLTAVNNNYGGRATYTYEPDANAAYRRVATSTVTSGEDNWAKVTSFKYTGPCYNSTGATCYSGHDWHQPSNALLGYAQVTQAVLTAATGGTTLAVTALNFYTDLNRLGFINQSRSMDPNQAVLQAQQTDYAVYTNTNPTFANLAEGAWFAAPQTATTYLAGDVGTSPNRQTAYRYDSYGHPVTVLDYGLNTVTGDERSTLRQYAANTAAWIVDTLSREDVYAGITGAFGAPAAGTKQYYDGATDIATPPTHGLLTRTDQWLNGQWVAVRQVSYDINGNPAVVTDANGNITRAGYDLSGAFVLSTTNALNQVNRYDFYGVNGVAVQDGDGATFGLLKTRTDPNGAATEYRYDPHGRLTQVIRPYDGASAPTTVYTYTDAYHVGGLSGLKVETCQRQVSGNASACQTRLAFYDGLGRPAQSRAEDVAGQVVVNTRYDALGHAVWANAPVLETASPDFSRPAGWDTRPGVATQYDALSRPLLVTNTDGTTVATAYLGATTIVTDANGHRRDSVADAYGRLSMAVEYSGTSVYTTTYAYDTLGNLRVVTDALGNTTVITYDALGRKTAMRDPDMGAWAYGYDPAGNLITQTDALGQVLWFRYDALNRLTEKRLGGGGGSLLASYGYDQGANGIGRRTSAWNANAAATTGYDTRGRVVTQSRTIGGVAGAFTTLYAYDAADRVVTLTHPGGEVVTTTYNAAGQPTALGGWNSYVTSASYNALGQPLRVDFGNGLSARYRYFGLNANPAWGASLYGRVRQVCVNQTMAGECADDGLAGDSATPLLNLVYWYDSVGNMAVQGDRSPSQRNAASFTYDPLDRLTGVTGSYTESYSYNATGNLTSKAGVTYSYTDTAHKHAVTGLSDGSSFQYDANGNMVVRVENGVSYTQTWDTDNRLIDVLSGTQHTQFFYDADGRLVKRTDPRGTTAYVGADDEVVWLAPTQTVTVTVPITWHKLYLPLVALGGLNAAAGVSTTYYRFGGARVAMRVNNAVYWLHGDHLGSANLTTDISGTKVSELRYTPYGETRYSTGDTPTNRRFTGQRQDGGLYDYGARFYDPQIGRFVSADSIVPQPGDPQSLNRYSYVRNSPLNRADPSGHGDVCNSALYSCGAGTNSSNLPAQTLPSPNVVTLDPWLIQTTFLASKTSWDKIPADYQIAMVSGNPGSIMPSVYADNLVGSAKELPRIEHPGTWLAAGIAGGYACLVFCGAMVAGAGAAGGLAEAEVAQGQDPWGGLQWAANFGIRSYGSLVRALQSDWPGLELEVHHLIEKRFAGTVGMLQSGIPSVVLTVDEHQAFTNAWRQYIGYANDSSAITTLNATTQHILDAAQQIYMNHPELLKAVEDAFIQ